MKTYLENPENNNFCEIIYNEDEDCLIIISGEIGSEGTQTIIEYEDAEEEYDAPPEWAFDDVVEERLDEGYEIILKPKDLLAQIEAVNDIELKGRLREFYESGEVVNYQDKYHNDLKCEINFDSRYAKSSSLEEYDEDFIIIAGKVNEEYYEDEQNWIGVLEKQGSILVYDLFTSSSYDLLYESFDEFLKSFE